MYKTFIRFVKFLSYEAFKIEKKTELVVTRDGIAVNLPTEEVKN